MFEEIHSVVTDDYPCPRQRCHDEALATILLPGMVCKNNACNRYMALEVFRTLSSCGSIPSGGRLRANLSGT